MKTVVVIGASPKTDRYAWKAMQMLKEYGHRRIPVNPAFQEVDGEHCLASVGEIGEAVDTVTLYLGAARSEPLIPEIIQLKPNRIIMNPGAENDHLAEEARANAIEVVEGCTLVMLRAGTF